MLKRRLTNGFQMAVDRGSLLCCTVATLTDFEVCGMPADFEVHFLVSVCIKNMPFKPTLNMRIAWHSNNEKRIVLHGFLANFAALQSSTQLFTALEAIVAEGI